MQWKETYTSTQNSEVTAWNSGKLQWFIAFWGTIIGSLTSMQYIRKVFKLTGNLIWIFLLIHIQNNVLFTKKNNNKFNCKTTSLSTDTKDYISQSDLIPGTELVWKNKGKKYTVMFKMFKGIPM